MHFGYAIEALGAGLSVPGGVSLTAEERQIDVDTSHGSLPKVGLSKAWGTHLLTSIGYAHSTGGNLATQYGLARIDIISGPIQFVLGGDAGHVSPPSSTSKAFCCPKPADSARNSSASPSPRDTWTSRCSPIASICRGSCAFTGTLTATVYLP